MDERPTLIRVAVLSRLLVNTLGELERENNQLLVEELIALRDQTESELHQLAELHRQKPDAPREGQADRPGLRIVRP